MDISSFAQAALPVVFAIVGIALVVLLIELVRTIRSARTMVDSVNEKLTPTLSNIEKMTDDLMPAISKVDPLVERVQLTVDAANLELMRVDKILEDVSDVTDTVSSATDAIDNITKTPSRIVTSLSEKVHGALTGNKPSSQSARLAAEHARAEREQEAANAVKPSTQPSDDSGATKVDVQTETTEQTAVSLQTETGSQTAVSPQVEIAEQTQVGAQTETKPSDSSANSDSTNSDTQAL